MPLPLECQPRPAPGFATVQGSRVLFTPPGTDAPVIPTGAAWSAEPLGTGGAILRDARGESWGVFANYAAAQHTAERLSR